MSQDKAQGTSVPRPLAGIRVLDLSNVLAGPFCAYQLALMGAEVLKIESPDGGDLARRLGADENAIAQNMGVSFLAVNGGKESMTLNLKADEGKAILRKLVAESDVLVENFRPGVMQRLGLGADVLRAVNPKLIYCAISGFGQEGPWAARPAYDQIIQGMSGLMSITGDVASAPLRVGFPVSDTLGGMAAAFAIVSALHGRTSSGEGTFIDMSMLDASLASMGWVVSNYLATQKIPQPMGNENVAASPSGTFRTKEGLLNIAANEQKQFESLCEAIGAPELVGDTRFATRDLRKLNRAVLNTEIERGLQAKDAISWEEELNTRGVPTGRIMSVDQVLSAPHMTARGLVVDLPEVAGRKPRVVASSALFDGARLSPASAPPTLGQHTDAWLTRLGYDAEDIARLRRDGVV
jgi:CoA:oxalate CoA-transferase